MASKRSNDNTSAPPAPKRPLLQDLVNNIGLDEGDYGPYMEPAADTVDLDALCNQAYEQHFGPAPHTPVSTENKIRIKVPVASASVALYPKEIDYKEFPLTKNGSKTLRLGLDITNFTPYILLLGESNVKSNRTWLRFTVDEFKIFISDEIQTHILSAIQKKELITPIPIGSFILSVVKINNMCTLCVKHTNSDIKIYLAESSVRMVLRSKSLMEAKLMQSLSHCTAAQNYWSEVLQLTKQFCFHQGYTALSEQEVSAAFLSIYNAFPHSLKQEMICYHFKFVKDQLVAYMRQQ